jgi:hypothetical protein
MASATAAPRAWTIQAMLARLDDRRPAGSPRQLELRHDQQEDALAFYDRILHQTNSNDPAIPRRHRPGAQ